jgi:hypothetical protein
MSTQSLNQPFIQAPPDAGQDVLAIVCVIDASLSLATEWTRVLTGYISPILKRLYETYSGYQVSFTVLLGSELDVVLVPASFGDVWCSRYAYIPTLVEALLLPGLAESHHEGLVR